MLPRTTTEKQAAIDELIPLTAATFQILVSLADQDRHGYAIMRDVSERTGGRFVLGSATLYTSIKRMLAQELIEESDERPDPQLDDTRRRYYRLTGLGRSVARAESERLAALLDQAQGRLAQQSGEAGI